MRCEECLRCAIHDLVEAEKWAHDQNLEEDIAEIRNLIGKLLDVLDEIKEGGGEREND